MTYVCTFVITRYGISGNELPPPSVAGYSHSVLSGNETEEAFRQRMQTEGMDLRKLLEHRFSANPRPYSCADSCSWSISKVGSVTELVKKINAS
jgi:hypothetical protein